MAAASSEDDNPDTPDSVAVPVTDNPSTTDTSPAAPGMNILLIYLL